MEHTENSNKCNSKSTTAKICPNNNNNNNNNHYIAFGFHHNTNNNQYHETYPPLLPLPPLLPPLQLPFPQNHNFRSRTHLHKPSFNQNHPFLATPSDFKIQQISGNQELRTPFTSFNTFMKKDWIFM